VLGEAVAVDAVQRRTAAFCSSKTTVPASRLLMAILSNGMKLVNSGGLRV